MAGINDLVLVHIDNKPGFFARIEEINPDVKPGWWQVRLLVLTIPLQIFTWILDESQINGAPYTMGGTPVRLEKVEPPGDKQGIPSMKGEGEREKKGVSKVVSLSERKKKE
jgi:hypothetical protein